MSTVTPDTDPNVFGDDHARRPGATDLDPVTGPMPAVELVDGHVAVTDCRGVTVVAIDGGLDDALAEIILPALRTATAHSDGVVLDLDRVTLLDRTALQSVCSVLDDLPTASGRCLVSGRLSGRMVLERWEMHGRYALFSSVADALQARTFIESGYGTGWDLPA